MNQNNEEQITLDEAMFLSILYSFHAAAMQAMGKVVNPITGKVERNLEAARGSIDALLMLQKKTQGNLTKREDGILKQIIQELQLNYVEESKTPEPETADMAETGGDPEEPAVDEGETEPENDKEPSDNEENDS
jgi:hypothetical protein